MTSRWKALLVTFGELENEFRSLERLKPTFFKMWGRNYSSLRYRIGTCHWTRPEIRFNSCMQIHHYVEPEIIQLGVDQVARHRLLINVLSALIPMPWMNRTKCHLRSRVPLSWKVL